MNLSTEALLRNSYLVRPGSNTNKNIPQKTAASLANVFINFLILASPMSIF